MHAAAQKIARALISHSPFHRCARKISRFARNDDAGKALLSFSACLRRISPLSFVPPVPYPPLWGTFPSRGRLWVWGSGILVSPPSPWREGSWTSPSFLWKEVPRRGGGWLPQRDEGEYTIVRPPVSSSRVQPRDLSCRRENSTYEEVRHSKSYEVRCLPLSHIFCLTSVQGRFLDFARNDDTGKAFHDKRRSRPSFLIRESSHRKPWTTTPMVSYCFFSQYATSVSAAPMPRAVLMPMPVYMAKEARVAARLAAMSFLKKP